MTAVVSGRIDQKISFDINKKLIQADVLIIVNNEK